jgi:hypothetical protein
MNFSEQPPSKQWAALKYRGEKFAEVWFKPEGEPLGLTFRIPRDSFQMPGVGPRLTAELLLKAVGVANEEVESWRLDGVPPPGVDGSNPALGHPLPPPPQEVTHLTVHLSIKPPPPVDAPQESGGAEKSGEPDTLLEQWQGLQARWNAILALEVTIDMLRQGMERLQSELQASLNKTLSTEEKLHALNADLAVWNKAKSRVHYALPKVKEFLHRATWAVGTPERKALGELFKDLGQPGAPLPPVDRVPEQLDSLLKARQALSAHGTTVHQECKNISSDIERALRMLQMNAARNADLKRRAAGPKGKFFKDFRRVSGID